LAIGQRRDAGCVRVRARRIRRFAGCGSDDRSTLGTALDAALKNHFDPFVFL